ncbi:hypothetical protein K0I73_07800 [Shewanella mesophila]|uniref:hypothetical protein n=1 Tax=Shewanella mesophila TaxID=2864208 RepID=UPI001C65D1C4|nr:hypothetical protein [Shewanella mesophila]QYJ87584.1 hypothetical protein K0I73_07800 [Shewanella mesophila]
MKLVLLSDPQSRAAQQAISHLFNDSNAPLRVGYLASEHESERHYYLQTQAFYSQFNTQLNCYVDLQQGYSDEKFNALCQADVIHLAGMKTM